MKLLNYLFFVFVWLSTSCTGAFPEIASHADWTEVHNISAIAAHAPESKKGVFLIDADEVLFTTTVADGAPILVRLHDDLEGLFSAIRHTGHSVYILTYNKAAEIRMKLSKVGLDETFFDGILSCEMTGDVMTAKGDLLRRHVAESSKTYDFAVFIDNFPPFVRNVQTVAQELGLPLHAYLCTGYIPLYHGYVYHHLSKLQKDLAQESDTATALVERIAKSLAKHRIDLDTFLTAYPDAESFIKWAQENELIWPYLTYL